MAAAAMRVNLAFVDEEVAVSSRKLCLLKPLSQILQQRLYCPHEDLENSDSLSLSCRCSEILQSSVKRPAMTASPMAALQAFPWRTARKPFLKNMLPGCMICVVLINNKDDSL